MIGLTEARLRTVLAWLVIALLGAPIGGALWLGFLHGESPCILCWAERTSMLLIALVALFVVRYGPRPRYLGMIIVLCGWGIFMATRHSALHLARDVGQGFAGVILGAHTYVWAWIIHFVVLLAAGALLLLYRGSMPGNADTEVNRAGRFAMGLLVVLAAANALQAFASTGPPPHIGQGDPIRLSWNPRHWVWGSEETQGKISWRGAWTIPRPDASRVDADPTHGPLRGLPTLPIRQWQRLAVPLNGKLTGFAVNAQGSALVTTDRFGVYVVDSTWTRVLHHVVIDPGFSIDLTPLTGAAFVGADTLAVLSTNKSYVLLEPDAHADAALEWRHFLETDSSVTELRRARFATVRARQNYVLSFAYDAAADQFITITVPSARHKPLVISRFDRSDLTLSSEFLPRLGEGLTARSERGVEDYVITGATVADGVLYAISAAYSTLLVIDLRTRTLTGAYAVPGITRPIGLAARRNQLLIAQADERVALIDRPSR